LGFLPGNLDFSQSGLGVGERLFMGNCGGERNTNDGSILSETMADVFERFR
jgi:hypothetical protein